jgi:ABC-type transport system substrate-binding protein
MAGDRSPEALAGLVFETLVTIDDRGRPQPALAIAWSSSNNDTHWEFALRPNVIFHDGTPLNATTVMRSLTQTSGEAWQMKAAGDRVIFDLPTPQPDLPAFLGLPQFAISAPSAEGSAVGTGPFRVVRSASAAFTLAANDDYWGGRPYVDSLELQTSRPSADQMTDFSLDRTDVAEVPADQLRVAQQERLRVEISRPEETWFLVFDSAKPEIRDLRLRQAVALAIDRTAIRNVIFQHQGEVASGLLPNWLSGYEFLFDSAQDVLRARQLRSEWRTLSPITIAYEPSDPAARLIAERIALNAHDIGVTVQAQPVTAGVSDLRVRRVSLASLDPAAALNDLVDRLGITLTANAPAESPYAIERAALDTYAAVPLVHLPRITLIGSRVHDWSASPRGDWHFDSVWLAPKNVRVEVHP